MPGPIVPRPAPTPRAMALPALRPAPSRAVASAWAIRSGRVERSMVLLFAFLVRFGDRAAEVDGGERREDEGLKACDQADLEQEEDGRDRHGQDADGRQAE